VRCAAFLCLLVPSIAAAEDEIDMGHVVAVQARPYRLVHEFRASLGVLPVDSFQTAITIGGSYTLHLSDVWAWEAFRFDYAINVDTGVQDMLASRWSIAPALERAELQYLFGTHLLVTPLYGKLAVLDDEVIHADIHLAAGGGVVHYADGFRPQLSAGPGVRIFLGSIVSLRLDVGAVVVPNAPGGTDVLIAVSFSVSSSFGTTRVTEQDERSPSRREVDGMETLDELYPETRPESEARR
jgi:outer membrane beta-barrel protein